jgi:methionyl-tRNA synthetase
MGKDNIPFHASIFPAMIMGQNQPYKLVDELCANEFYNLEGRQFSKSDGWYIDLDDFFTHYTSDQIRYAIASNAPETADSEFTWKDFQLRCNSDLVGKYGNLANRVLVFLRARCGEKNPSFSTIELIDQEFLDQIQSIAHAARTSYEEHKLRKASQLIMELAQLGNIYFDQKKPWKDAKQQETHDRMMTTIGCCLECLKTLALISSPIIPTAAQALWELLGYASRLEEQEWSAVLSQKVPEDQAIPEPKILFKKIEDFEIEREIEKLTQLKRYSH